MKNVLIVCTANKTRSIMAMYIANKIAAEKNKSYCFKSAGIAVMGSEADERAKEILAEMGIECEHTPTGINEYDLAYFDEIHVMTKRHKKVLISYYPETDAEEKIFVLGIDDPSGSGVEAYRECKNKLVDFYRDYIV